MRRNFPPVRTFRTAAEIYGIPRGSIRWHLGQQRIANNRRAAQARALAYREMRELERIEARAIATREMRQLERIENSRANVARMRRANRRAILRARRAGFRQARRYYDDWDDMEDTIETAKKQISTGHSKEALETLMDESPTTGKRNARDMEVKALAQAEAAVTPVRVQSSSSSSAASPAYDGEYAQQWKAYMIVNYNLQVAQGKHTTLYENLDPVQKDALHAQFEKLFYEHTGTILRS